MPFICTMHVACYLETVVLCTLALAYHSSKIICPGIVKVKVFFWPCFPILWIEYQLNQVIHTKQMKIKGVLEVNNY